MNSAIEKSPGDASSAIRSLVIYHFYERDISYIRNFAHFLLFGYSTMCDYVVVVAGRQTIELPQRPNIEYLFTENKNNDFGGYCAAVQALGDRLSNYDYVHFVNSSVRGPFMPQGCNLDWKTLFQEKLTSDVGLAGCSINISFHVGGYQAKYGGVPPYSHVQTTAYAVPRRTMDFLKAQRFYEHSKQLNKLEVIEDYELRLSQLILQNGWNIAALLPEYCALDYRREHHKIDPTCIQTDPLDPYSYFGRTAHPFELLFVKTNRPVFFHEYLDRLAYSAYCRERPSLEFEQNRILLDYVNHLHEVSRSNARVPFAPPSIDDVCLWVSQVLAHHPHQRARLEALLGEAAPGANSIQ